MKHPALARVMAVTLAIMCVIMLIVGALGFGKAKSEYAEDTADYEKLTDRIATYNELTAKLADAESYKQVSAELDEHRQQHDDDAAQYRTDLAERTAKQGGYKQGAEALWEARAQAKEGLWAYQNAKAQFDSAEKEYNTKAAQGQQLKTACDTLIPACRTLAPILANPKPEDPGEAPTLNVTDPSTDPEWTEAKKTECAEDYNKACNDYAAAKAEYDAQMADYQPKAKAYNTYITAEQTLAGANTILTAAGEQTVTDLTAAAAALTQLSQMTSAALAEGKTQIEAARTKLNAAWSKLDGVIEKIDGNLAQLWYDMGKLDDEEPELAERREALLDEAVALAEEKAIAEERKEDEQKLGATRRTLKAYDGIKARLTDDAELGEVAAQYADEYYVEFNRAHKARIVISVLEVLGGILGLCCLPAAFEKCRSRAVLIAPAGAAFVCAAGAVVIAAALTLGTSYAALPALIFAPLYLLAAAPKKKQPQE